jgi:hypothetical protein
MKNERSSYSTNSTNSRAPIFPRIKPAIEIIVRAEGAEIFVGNSHEGYLLDAYPYLAILRECTGWFNLDEISERCNQPLHIIEKIVGQQGDLIQLGVVETRGHSSHAPWVKIHDQQELHRAIQNEIESSLITFRASDGGQAEWNARAHYGITICGDTRIARALLPLLCASGFIQTQLQSLPTDEPLLQAKDLNALSVTTDHLAKSKALHHRDLIRVSRGSSAATSTVNNPLKRDLIIATSQPHAEQIQQWQSDAVPHLAMGEAIAGLIEIFPVIQPGLTPCLRCIQLHKRDALPRDLSLLAASLTPTFRGASAELPVASAALIAALLASSVANYFVKPAIGFHSQLINLLEPTLPLEDRDLRKWNFHPECGCVDVRRRASPR